MNLGSQHLQLRKRLFKNLEPFPSPHAGKRYFDYLMYGVGVVQPLALLPQVISIYGNHETAGVSMLTWSLLTVFNMLWATNGILHHEVPIATANTLLTLLDLSIIVGIFLYH